MNKTETLGDILASVFYKNDLKEREEIIEKMVDLAYELARVEKSIRAYEETK